MHLKLAASTMLALDMCTKLYLTNQQANPTNVKETNDGKSTNPEGQDLSTDQKDTNGHQVQDKE